MNIRRNGELMKNSNGKIISHIYGMFFKIANYLSLNITPIFIFDGKPPDEKSNVIKERKEKAEKATIKKKESITKEEVIEMCLSEDLYPPKTSKHTISNHMPPIHVLLEVLAKSE